MKTTEEIKNYYKNLHDTLATELNERYLAKIRRLYDTSYDDEGGRVTIHQDRYILLEDYVRMENHYQDARVFLAKVKAVKGSPMYLLKMIKDLVRL